MTFTPGDLVPDFKAHSDDGAAVTLSAWRGHWVVLFFFPNAAATHCQMQARRFQALSDEFDQLGVRLLGVSVDTRNQHKAFRDLCKLSFPLVSDQDQRLSRQFDVLTEMEGSEILRARRLTFLIDPQGQLVQRWDDVSPNTNAAEVLEAVRAYQAQPHRN